MGGGIHRSTLPSIRRGLEMIQQGVDIIDIGGESTRPGSLPISIAEEIERTIPTIKALHKESSILISIDTSKAEVAKKALEAGANIINDVTGMQDPESFI